MPARLPRLLVLTPDYPPMGGEIQHLVHRVVSNLDRMTVRTVAPAAFGAGAADQAEGLDVFRVGPARHRPAAVAAINAWAVAEAARFRPDLILSAHLITSPGARAVALTQRIPFVQYLHATEIGTRPALAAFAQRGARVSIAVSLYTRDLALQAGGDPARLVVMPPGVDLSLARSKGRPNEPPTIVTVARMVDRFKGHDVMTRALPLVISRVPSARWVVIGSGRLRDEIERLVATSGMSEHVIFTGSVDDTERDAWLDRAHVFAMPSRIRHNRAGEGFGIAYLEAGAHGLPVVAGNVGGALDAVTDGETGVLVDATDPLAVADALTDLLLDKNLAARLGATGRRRAEALAWPVAARRVEELLLAVAAGRG